MRRLQAPPARAVGRREEVAVGPVGVLRVAEREHRVEVEPEQDVGGLLLAAVAGVPSAAAEVAVGRIAGDVAGRGDDGVAAGGLPGGGERVGPPARELADLPAAGGEDEDLPAPARAGE